VDIAAGPLALARHDLNRGRPDRALEALEGVRGDEIEEREFWALRAHALYDLRRWKEAVVAARSGLERAPGDLELLDVLALGQLESGKRRDALATIELALAVHPEHAGLHAHRGLILARSAKRAFRLQRYDKARVAVDEALRLDPHNDAAVRVRAQIAMLSRDPHAAEYSRQLLAADPEDEHAHIVTGSALAGRGDLMGGLQHYVEAARLDPSNARLAWLGRRSRIMQGRLAAPLRYAHQVTGGRLRFVWVIVVLASLQVHEPILTAAVFGFWAYTWAVHLYVHLRVGKKPK
jgi:tetratricopeptide (TPR) repeat protein